MEGHKSVGFFQNVLGGKKITLKIDHIRDGSKDALEKKLCEDMWYLLQDMGQRRRNLGVTDARGYLSLTQWQNTFHVIKYRKTSLECRVYGNCVKMLVSLFTED